MQKKIVTLLLVAGFGCAKPVAFPDPLTVPLEEMVVSESNPQRAASMRLTVKGRNELRQSKLERAAHRFSKAIEVDRSNPFPYFYLGLVRFRGTRLDQAQSLFGRAAELFETQRTWKAESLAYRAESFEKLERPEEAIAEYEIALSYDGRNARAREGLYRIRATPTQRY